MAVNLGLLQTIGPQLQRLALINTHKFNSKRESNDRGHINKVDMIFPRFLNTVKGVLFFNGLVLGLEFKDIPSERCTGYLFMKGSRSLKRAYITHMHTFSMLQHQLQSYTWTLAHSFPILFILAR